MPLIIVIKSDFAPVSLTRDRGVPNQNERIH